MLNYPWRRWLRGTGTPVAQDKRRKGKAKGLRRFGSAPRLEELERRLVPTSPTVLSILRTVPLGPATNATSVSYTATFSEAVTGVDATDFQLALTGTVGATLTQVTPVSTAAYKVDV